MNKIARIFAAAAIAIGLASLPTASFAHTEVVSATPAPDSTVDADNFFMIDLEFGEDLLQTAGETGSAIKLVSDSTGQELHVDCLYVEGAHLMAQAALYESGPVTLTWRTVGDDGHPISDSYKFNVTGSQDAPKDYVGYCTSGRAYADNSAAQNTAPTTDSTSSGNSGNGLIGLGVGVVIIIGFSVFGGIKAKRRMDEEANRND
jgi:methionine-rich copper-binding protein CopC